jgi:hypothetical protein
MLVKIPSLRGHIKVEIIDLTGKKTVVDKANTLVKESPKMLLANLIAPSMITDGTNFPTTAGRPNVKAWATGANTYNSLGYMRFGYYDEGADVPSISVSADDHVMARATVNKVVTFAITSITIESFAIKVVCEFQVTTSTKDYNYIEAGLYTAGSNVASGSVLAPDNVGYNAATSLMFAHQTHTAVQASAGSTIRYTWTITMEEPT